MQGFVDAGRRGCSDTLLFLQVCMNEQDSLTNTKGTYRRFRYPTIRMHNRLHLPKLILEFGDVDNERIGLV